MIWSFSLVLIPFLSLWSQEFEEETKPFFREDQIYVGVSLVLVQSNQEDFDPKGISRQFQWGFVRDIPISATGKWATAAGLGMSFERYNTNLIRSLNNSNSVNYSFAGESTNPLFFSLHSLEFPLSIRWRNATVDDFAFWRVYGGVYFRCNYRNKIFQEDLEITNSKDLNSFGTVAHLSFGYNTWNFYLAYHLSPFFTKTSVDSQTLPLELNPIKIGLIFYFL